VDFFLLQDLVADDYSHFAVTTFPPFDDFRFPPARRDIDTYREHRRHSIEYIDARNIRIERCVGARATMPRAWCDVS
jgi:hypothetical protein